MDPAPGTTSMNVDHAPGADDRNDEQLSELECLCLAGKYLRLAHMKRNTTSYGDVNEVIRKQHELLDRMETYSLQCNAETENYIQCAAHDSIEKLEFNIRANSMQYELMKARNGHQGVCSYMHKDVREACMAASLYHDAIARSMRREASRAGSELEAGQSLQGINFPLPSHRQNEGSTSAEPAVPAVFNVTLNMNELLGKAMEHEVVADQLRVEVFRHHEYDAQVPK
jgi:hypothetical protein